MNQGPILPQGSGDGQSPEEAQDAAWLMRHFVAYERGLIAAADLSSGRSAKRSRRRHLNVYAKKNCEEARGNR